MAPCSQNFSRLRVHPLTYLPRFVVYRDCHLLPVLVRGDEVSTSPGSHTKLLEKSIPETVLSQCFFFHIQAGDYFGAYAFHPDFFVDHVSIVNVDGTARADMLEFL